MLTLTHPMELMLAHELAEDDEMRDVLLHRVALREKGKHSCYILACDEEAKGCCDACDKWCCATHSHHWEAHECSCGETTQCNTCVEKAGRS